MDDLNEEKTLLVWEAAERSYKKRDRDFWVTAVSTLVLVSVILVLVKEFFLIVALVSVLFLYYALSAVPPELSKYKLTNRGVYFGELFYPWVDLVRFWFGKSLNSEMIHFETALRFPRQVSLVIKADDKEKIKAVVIKKLPYVEEVPSFVDKLSAWGTKKLQLEDRKK